MHTRRIDGIRPSGPILLALLVALAGCASTPVSVRRVSAEDALRQLTTNALTHGEPSDSSLIVLRRYDLIERFESDPTAALAALHEDLVRGGGGNDETFALAELSFLYARKSGNRAHYLASALYAYTAAVLGGQGGFSPFDPRVRQAADLYNVALTEVFMKPDGSALELKGGELALPFGKLRVDFDEQSLLWGGRRLDDLVPVTELEVWGLRNRYRRAGIGVPLAARTEPVEGEDALEKLLNPKVRVPATVVLRIDDPRRQLGQKELTGRLELYTADQADHLTFEDGSTVPLELEPSAALAMTLTESRFWQMEYGALRGALRRTDRPIALSMREPYRDGRIPVVFVHGTASSAARWADMVNDLDADPRIRERFQFWFFIYDSGNPISYSSLQLRRALNDAVKVLQPKDSQGCLQHMVLVGHSQGGLLAKMAVIESGDRLWANVSKEPFESAKLRPKSRDLLREALFVEPLPSVRRVVFIATPHRGSFMASGDFVRRMAARLIRLPDDVLDLSNDLPGVDAGKPTELSLERIPTSIDNMSPGNKFIQVLGDIPVAPGIAVNSIIPVEGDGPFEDGNDGVVQYRSAHIDGVESELVVRSNHSTQANPLTIREVKRILNKHGELGCDAR